MVTFKYIFSLLLFQYFLFSKGCYYNNNLRDSTRQSKEIILRQRQRESLSEHNDFS